MLSAGGARNRTVRVHKSMSFMSSSSAKQKQNHETECIHWILAFASVNPLWRALR